MATVDIAIAEKGTVTRYTGDPTFYQSYDVPNIVALGSGGVSFPPDFNEWIAVNRGLIQFDTSSLVGVTITKVELYRKWLSGPPEYVAANGECNFTLTYAIGDFGSALDYNQTEFDAGTDCFTESGVGSTMTNDGVFLDLGANGIAGINTAGRTTIKIYNPVNDDYPDNLPDSNASCVYNVTTDPCYLRITTPDPGCSPFQLMGGS